MGTKVGVYGTLKKGQRAAGMMATSTFKGEHKVSMPFAMYNVGAFPALVKDDTNHDITIEVYEVPDKVIPILDTYEGYPYLYQKSAIQVDGDDVILYTMERSTEFVNNHKVIKSGNWVLNKN